MNGSCEGMCSVKRHPPSSFDSALRRAAAFACAGSPASRCFVRFRDDELPGVRRIEHVLRILLRQLRELALQRLQPRALFRRQDRRRPAGNPSPFLP